MNNLLTSMTMDNPWLCRTARIDAITPETPGVATYDLSFLDSGHQESYQFQPGQFNMLYLPGIGEIPISLSADPRARSSWAHTIRIAGNVTRSLSGMRPGGTLGLRGPFGTSWPLEQMGGADIVLVAGGIGIAPLRSVIYTLLSRPHEYGQVTLLYGARSPESLLYSQEYPRWIEQGLRLEVTVDRAAPSWAGMVGFVNLLVERMRLAAPRNTMILTCGPEVMMRYIVRSGLERGIGVDRVWCSLERNMQCAVGLCGHCLLGPEFICKDGPIFRFDRVQPWLTVESL